jgi:hypothetical protein
MGELSSMICYFMDISNFAEIGMVLEGCPMKVERAGRKAKKQRQKY